MIIHSINLLVYCQLHLWLSQPVTTHFIFSMLTPKWHKIFLKEESLQHVFIIEISFEEIDGYKCKSNCIKGGCSRVQITSIILNRPLSFFSKLFCINNTCRHRTTCRVFLGFFLASFLGTSNNTPNFTVTSTKKFELHILTPLSTWKNCKNYEIQLYLMSCTKGCRKPQT